MPSKTKIRTSREPGVRLVYNTVYIKSALLTCQLIIHILFSDCDNGDVRLVNGANSHEGRVEFCYDEDWGTVCDDFWDDVNAGVVCRQLGFPSEGAIAFSDAFFDEGTGPILLDDVICVGTESRLDDCFANSIGSHNCFHSEDAGVRCTSAGSASGMLQIQSSQLSLILSESHSFHCNLTLSLP